MHSDRVSSLPTQGTLAPMSEMDVGANRHVWETRLVALEDELPGEPVTALPELLDLLDEILDQTELDAEVDDPEVHAVRDRARELVAAHERGDDVRHDDAQQAAAELRALIREAISSPTVDGQAELRERPDDWDG